MITHHTLECFGPILISAGSAGPVLCVSVESVTVIVLLTGVCGGGRGSGARSGTRRLGRLGGTARLLGVMSLVSWLLPVLLLLLLSMLPLTEALGATDSPRPVEIGAHVA